MAIQKNGKTDTSQKQKYKLNKVNKVNKLNKVNNVNKLNKLNISNKLNKQHEQHKQHKIQPQSTRQKDTTKLQSTRQKDTTRLQSTRQNSNQTLKLQLHSKKSKESQTKNANKSETKPQTVIEQERELKTKEEEGVSSSFLDDNKIYNFDQLVNETVKTKSINSVSSSITSKINNLLYHREPFYQSKKQFAEKTVYAVTKPYETNIYHPFYQTPLLLMPYILPEKRQSVIQPSTKLSRFIQLKQNSSESWKHVIDKTKQWKFKYDLKSFSLSLISNPKTLWYVILSIVNNKTEVITVVINFVIIFHTILEILNKHTTFFNIDLNPSQQTKETDKNKYQYIFQKIQNTLRTLINHTDFKKWGIQVTSFSFVMWLILLRKQNNRKDITKTKKQYYSKLIGLFFLLTGVLLLYTLEFNPTQLPIYFNKIKLYIETIDVHKKLNEFYTIVIHKTLEINQRIQEIKATSTEYAIDVYQRVSKRFMEKVDEFAFYIAESMIIFAELIRRNKSEKTGKYKFKHEKLHNLEIDKLVSSRDALQTQLISMNKSVDELRRIIMEKQTKLIETEKLHKERQRNSKNKIRILTASFNENQKKLIATNKDLETIQKLYDKEIKNTTSLRNKIGEHEKELIETKKFYIKKIDKLVSSRKNLEKQLNDMNNSVVELNRIIMENQTKLIATNKNLETIQKLYDKEIKTTTSLQNEIENHEEELIETKKFYIKKIDELVSSRKNLEKQLNDMNNLVVDLNHTIMENQKKLIATNKKHAENISQIRKQLEDEATTSLQKKIGEHEQKLIETEKIHINEINKLVSSRDNFKKQLNDVKNSVVDLNSLIMENQIKLTATNKDLETIQKSYDEEIKNTTSLQNEIENHKKKLIEIEKNHMNEINNLVSSRNYFQKQLNDVNNSVINLNRTITEQKNDLENKQIKAETETITKLTNEKSDLETDLENMQLHYDLLDANKTVRINTCQKNIEDASSALDVATTEFNKIETEKSTLLTKVTTLSTVLLDNMQNSGVDPELIKLLKNAIDKQETEDFKKVIQKIEENKKDAQENEKTDEEQQDHAINDLDKQLRDLENEFELAGYVSNVKHYSGGSKKHTTKNDYIHDLQRRFLTLVQLSTQPLHFRRDVHKKVANSLHFMKTKLTDSINDDFTDKQLLKQIDQLIDDNQLFISINELMNSDNVDVLNDKFEKMKNKENDQIVKCYERQKLHFQMKTVLNSVADILSINEFDSNNPNVFISDITAKKDFLMLLFKEIDPKINDDTKLSKPVQDAILDSIKTLNEEKEKADTLISSIRKRIKQITNTDPDPDSDSDSKQSNDNVTHLLEDLINMFQDERIKFTNEESTTNDLQKTMTKLLDFVDTDTNAGILYIMKPSFYQELHNELTHIADQHIVSDHNKQQLQTILKKIVKLQKIQTEHNIDLVNKSTKFPIDLLFLTDTSLINTIYEKYNDSFKKDVDTIIANIEMSFNEKEEIKEKVFYIPNHDDLRIFLMLLDDKYKFFTQYGNFTLNTKKNNDLGYQNNDGTAESQDGWFTSKNYMKIKAQYFNLSNECIDILTVLKTFVFEKQNDKWVCNKKYNHHEKLFSNFLELYTKLYKQLDEYFEYVQTVEENNHRSKSKNTVLFQIDAGYNIQHRYIPFLNAENQVMEDEISDVPVKEVYVAIIGLMRASFNSTYRQQHIEFKIVVTVPNSLGKRYKININDAFENVDAYKLSISLQKPNSLPFYDVLHLLYAVLTPLKNTRRCVVTNKITNEKQHFSPIFTLQPLKVTDLASVLEKNESQLVDKNNKPHNLCYNELQKRMDYRHSSLFFTSLFHLILEETDIDTDNKELKELKDASTIENIIIKLDDQLKEYNEIDNKKHFLDCLQDFRDNTHYTENKKRLRNELENNYFLYAKKMK